MRAPGQGPGDAWRRARVTPAANREDAVPKRGRQGAVTVSGWLVSTVGWEPRTT